jgi:hypothetical protein
MATWREFAAASPGLAAKARERLHGRVSYLATTRADGSPRVHPVTPIVAEDELFVFMEPTSPKGHDLRRDGRYQLHVGVEDTNGGGGELYVRGIARLTEDEATRLRATGTSPYRPADRYILFVFGVDEAMLTTYGERGAVRDRWRAEKRNSVVAPTGAFTLHNADERTAG